MFRLIHALLIAALLQFFSSHVARADEQQLPIKIGAIFSLTGFGALGGQSELNAMQLALEDVNSEGGVSGHTLELVVEDNRSTQVDTANAVNKLVSVDSVPIILGPNWAEFSEVAAPIAESKGVSLLTVTGWTRTLTKGRSFIFTLLPPHEVHVRPLAKYIEGQGGKRIGFLYTSNSYLESITQSLISQLKARGIELEDLGSVDPESRDFKALILRLKKDNLDGVFAGILQNGSMGTFLRQARELDLKIPIYTPDITFYESVLKGIEVAEGIVFFHYLPSKGEDLIRRYREKFKSEPLYSLAPAYDALRMVKGVLEKCGISRSEVRACLEKVDYSGVSGRIRFDEKHELMEPEDITSVFTIKAGQFQPVG